MDKKEDLRTRMTTLMLTQTLFDLMQKKPFDEITVVDICKAAQVNRSTFYNHFEDKHQLLNQLFSEIHQRFRRRSAEYPTEEGTKHEYYLFFLEQILNDIQTHRKFYESGLLHGKSYLNQVFKDSIRQYLIESFEEDVASGSLRFLLPIPIIAEYFSGAFMSMAAWWLRGEMEIPIETLISYADLLISGNFIAPGS